MSDREQSPVERLQQCIEALSGQLADAASSAELARAAELVREAAHSQAELERENAELREMQRDQERAQSMVQVGFWRFDLAACTVAATAQARSIYGVKEGEWTIAQVQTIPLPEYRAALDAAMDALIKDGTPYDTEYRIRRLDDGEVRHVRAVAEYDAEKHHVFGTIQDVTDSKQRQEQIALLGEMLDAAPVAVAVHDAAGGHLFANRQVALVHGYEDEREFLAVNVHDLGTPGNAAHFDERVREIEANGEARFEVVHRRKDGGLVPLDVMAKAIDWHGQPAVLSIAVDVSERKATEASMRLQALVFDQIADQVTVTDLDGIITAVNDAEVRVLGYPREELVGQPVSKYGEDSLRGATQREIVEVTRREGHWRGEVVNRAADGHEVVLDCRTQLVHDGDGVPVALCGVSTDITERKRAERTIRRHTARLRAIVQILQQPHGDLQSFLDYALAKAVSLSRSAIGCILLYDEEHGEFTVGSWSGATVGSRSASGSPVCLELGGGSVWRDVVQQRKAILLNEFEKEFLPDDGGGGDHVRVVRLLAVPVFHQERIRAVVGMANRQTDYTENDALELTLLMDAVWRSVENLRAEQALRESEQRNRRLSDVTMEGIVIHRQAVPVDMNAAICRMFGYSREELMVCEFSEFVHPDDWETARQNIIDKVTQPYTVRALRRDGTCFYAEVESRDFELGGECLRVTAVRDVSERHQALQALRESEERFRQVYEHMAIGVARVSLEFRIEAANDAYCTMLGYTEDELVGKHLREITHPDVADENFRLQRQLRDGEIKHFRMEKAFVHRDGHSVHGILDAAVVHDAEGNPSYFLGSVVDITEARESERERELLREQLAQAQRLESVGRLAGGVAHDFNNMLNVILGHAEMVLDDLPAESPLRSDLEEIRSAGQRSAKLTRQLLAFARRQTVAPQILDINETVGEMLSMLRRLIGEDVALLWVPGRVSESVRIDPAQVDQMLANLCVNARDAIGHGSGKITIETGRVEFGEDYCSERLDYVPGVYVMLAVSDDGCGMDAETQANIFEPFFTTKEVGEGTGLGLATVYGIVKQNGGFINVYSEVGQGTMFHIYLPAYTPLQPARPPAGREQPIEQGSETVLLVEDEPTILNMVTKMLERLGYTVLATSVPQEAIRLAQEYEGDIHLLITDVVMPEMNGRELATTLLPLRPGLPRLFMSGYTSDIIARQGVLEDGVDFIQKPFSVRALSAKLREVLGR